MNYLGQQISLNNFVKIIVITLITALPFFYTIQSLVQFSYQTKSIEYFFKLSSGFLVVFLFPKDYWIRIPAIILILSPVYSFLIIGSDQLRAMEYLTSPKYSNHEIKIQSSLNVVCVALFFLLNYFEKIKSGEGLFDKKNRKSEIRVVDPDFKYSDLFLGKILVLGFLLNLLGIYFYLIYFGFVEKSVGDANAIGHAQKVFYKLIFGLLSAAFAISLSLGFKILNNNKNQTWASLSKIGSILFLVSTFSLFIQSFLLIIKVAKNFAP